MHLIQSLSHLIQSLSHLIQSLSQRRPKIAWICSSDPSSYILRIKVLQPQPPHTVKQALVDLNRNPLTHDYSNRTQSSVKIKSNSSKFEMQVNQKSMSSVSYLCVAGWNALSSHVYILQKVCGLRSTSGNQELCTCTIIRWPAEQKTPLVSQLFLCLSRACLRFKRVQKRRFAHPCGSNGKCLAC